MVKPKTDAVLLEAADLARQQLSDIADEQQIGEHAGVTAEEDRLLTHRFTAHKPGYRGWEWYVTVARAPRSKKVTVCELGLLPGQQALLAPAWVPWAERLKKSEQADAAEAGSAQDDQAHADPAEAGQSANGQPASAQPEEPAQPSR